MRMMFQQICETNLVGVPGKTPYFYGLSPVAGGNYEHHLW